ncbi:AMP-binding enzyme family protein (macronuclear) [Tetrahymena thermophila SB210]|uniref:AMP-binding enzyme family protein n=1 Tax=Tetrahymena thermophila (strain SB210) TaxID=312017 RepID=Q241W4_TETTS|nr:AMP-binding enzyme family protein [Tetrahymena thermophila SB210]EAS02587.2 AMP-binding enzyme family protein [Tetrahymena thermophila SB210]|eukprot:XP_001022832.2 AMP-binding enzyme family protein [Tetrahymena thermophila SB210]
MIFSKLDLFSSYFTFNTGNYQIKRGTLLGTVLSFVIVITTLSYLIYLIQQYVTNQIDPVYRSQSLISQDYIQAILNSDFVGFRFEQDSQIQLSQDKTYIVYLAFFEYVTPDSSLYLPLNVIECTHPSLLGFKCLDFSSLKNQTLFLNTNQNAKSTVQIMTYGCLDLDQLKTSIPQNCANQTEIDYVINGVNSLLRFKLFTSQYNTATRNVEINYRNAYIYTIANQQILTQLKIQNQNTSVKQGSIIQSESYFSSPIQYTQQDQFFDRQYALLYTGAGSYSQAIVMIDEIIQHIQIQYPTFPQVLALVSSIFTLLMIVGIFGKMVSQKSIQNDFVILFLKNIYQQNYLRVLRKQNDFIDSQKEIQIKSQDRLDIEEQKENNVDEINVECGQQQNIQQIIIPAFQNKQKVCLENGQQYKNMRQNYESELFSSNSLQMSCNSQLPKYTKQQNQAQERAQNNLDKDTYYNEQFMSQEQEFNQKLYLQKQIKSNSDSQNNILKKLTSNQLQDQATNQVLCQSNQIQFNQNQQYSENLIQNLLEVQNVSKYKIIQKDFKKVKKEMLNQSEFQFKKVEYQIKKDMNIFNFIKEIILLKKAVMMLLSKEQLAALNVIGCSSSFLQLNLSKASSNLDQFQISQNLSHYEMQIAILQKEKFQDYYIQKFLSRCSEPVNNETDKRILQSIQKCHQQ